MIKLTKRQQEVLDLIRQAVRENGMPPTRAEISAQLGFRSPNAAEEHLRALARKGAIEMMPGTSRGIRLPPEEEAALEAEQPGIPVLGQVAAGSPVLAEQNIDYHLQVNPEAFRRRADYFLRVKGLSMKNIGIMEGDLLAVHRSKEAPKNGELVVARIGDEVTVKRFQQKGREVWLLAENEDFAPIRVDLSAEEFSIEGYAVGLIREDFSQRLH